MSKERKPSNFVDLVSYKQATRPAKGNHGNVIKSKQVHCSGTEMIQVSSDDADQPTIVTRTEDGVVVAVEFCCPCGRKASAELDYEHS